MLRTRYLGTDLIPSVPWGTHFCQFYDTSQDLFDQVVPYLKAGLERREACVWVTSEPMTPAAAGAALGAFVPDLDRLQLRGQVHIAPYSEWYLQDGVFDRERVLDGWLAYLQAALDRGYEGLRVTGNTAWLEKAGWADFTDYEAAISGAIEGRPVLVLCTYALSRCGAHEILDVVKNHDFAIIKRGAAWEVVQSPTHRVLQDALRDSEQRYQDLFQHALNGIAVHDIVTDDDGEPINYVFVDANRAFEAMTGLKAADIIGRRVTEVLPGTEQTGFIRTYGGVALTGEPTRFEAFSPELNRHFDINAFSPRRGQFAAVFHDVTEQKRAEADRERLFKETQDANRLKDEFLATLSHELRTPLNAILGWSHLLAGGALDAAAQQRAVDAIARNAEVQNRLVSDVLEVSRIITGKLRLALGEVDMVRLVDDALAAIRPAADAKRIRLTTDVRMPTARLVGDRDRLQQVLWNLLSNAVKFTPSDGTVAVEIDEVDSRIRLRVTDSGIGIGPEFLPRVFERFTQADGSASRQHGGLGLGLAIVRHLIELHGGTVRAESAGEGCGAAFVVELPVRAIVPEEAGEEPRAAGATEPRLAPRDLFGLDVLVVDDDADARELISVTLNQAGAGVTAVGSASEALSALRSAIFHVVVSDIGMPEVDGYELMEAIRGLDGPARSIPAVALTAYGRPEDCARARAVGYQQHVAKPVRPSELVSRVFEAANRSTAAFGEA